MSQSQPYSWDNANDGAASASMLLRLPPEIRTRVYELVLGGEAVHLIYTDRRLCHTRCTTVYPVTSLRRGELGCQEAAQAKAQISWRKRAEETPQHPIAVPFPDAIAVTHVSLLSTCRQINSEASAVLYSSLVFHADKSKAWLQFANKLRLETLASIQTLFIRLKPHDQVGIPMEVEFWSLAANKMTGFRHLHVAITYDKARLRREFWPAWNKPMLQVRGLESFDLSINDGFGDSPEAAAFHEKVQTILCSKSDDRLL